jgi:tRNA threonylcarbamoyl adenosine modification protein YeaZ
MNLLAFDSALGACSVVVWCGDSVAARRAERRARGHAEALMPMIEAAMVESGLAFAGLDHLAVTVGPGTFTGIRIGLAAARGLGLATGLGVLGVTTLETVAAGARETVRDGEAIVVALDARRGEVYTQTFDPELRALDAAAACAPAVAAAPNWCGTRLSRVGRGIAGRRRSTRCRTRPMWRGSRRGASPPARRRSVIRRSRFICDHRARGAAAVTVPRSAIRDENLLLLWSQRIRIHFLVLNTWRTAVTWRIKLRPTNCSRSPRTSCRRTCPTIRFKAPSCRS